MKRKLVSVLLAAVMTVSSLSITSAASVDADDFISSEETVVEHEQETDEEQEDQLQTETETPSQTSSGTDIGDVTAGEDIITDTPTNNVVETPTEVPHSVKTKAEKADIFFNDDLKKLKNGTLEKPSLLSDETETETETESAEEKEQKAASIDAAKKILPEEYASLLTEDSYDLLMEQEHEYKTSETVDFYIVPASGYEVDTVKASYTCGEIPVTDFETGVYEITMPEDDLLIEVKTKEKADVEIETEEAEEADVEVETESETETETKPADVECTCLSDSENGYDHDWDCPVFWKQFKADCSCGVEDEKVTSHNFDCDAFIKAIAAACTCEVKDEYPCMHDECEVIERMHRELCDCGENYTVIDDIISTHEATSRILTYIMAWNDYCNEPATTAAPPLSPVAPGVAMSTNYALSFRFTPGLTQFSYGHEAINSSTADAGAYRNFNNLKSVWDDAGKSFPSSGVAFALTDNTTNASKSGKTSYWARYTNVCKVGNQWYDLKIFSQYWQGAYKHIYDFKNGSPSQNVRGTLVYSADGNKIGVYVVNCRRIKLQYWLMKSGTNEGSGINAHLTFADVDDDQAIIFRKDESGPTAAYYANTGRLSTKDDGTFTGIKASGYNSSDNDRNNWVQIDFTTGFSSWFECNASYVTGRTANYLAYVATTANTLGYYEDPAPNKYVYKVVNGQNTLGGRHSTAQGGDNLDTQALKVNEGDTVLYEIAQHVYPNQNTYLAFDDSFDPCLNITGYGVYNNEWQNVTGSFNWRNSGNRIIAEKTLTEEESNCHTFHLLVYATVKSNRTLYNHGHSASTYWNLSNQALVWTTSTDHGDHKNVTNQSWIWGQHQAAYKVKKVDSVTNANLTGAEFTLYEAYDEQLSGWTNRGKLTYNASTGYYETPTLTFNASGSKGWFKIVETKAPDGYVGGWSSSHFNLLDTANGTVFTAPNEKTKPAKGNLKVIKKIAASEGDVEDLLEAYDSEDLDFRFQLYGSADNGTTVNESRDVHGSGTALFKDIPIGTYTLKESIYIDDYWTPSAITQQVIIEGDQTKEVTVTNTFKPKRTPQPDPIKSLNKESSAEKRQTTKTIQRRSDEITFSIFQQIKASDHAVVAPYRIMVMDQLDKAFEYKGFKAYLSQNAGTSWTEDTSSFKESTNDNRFYVYKDYRYMNTAQWYRFDITVKVRDDAHLDDYIQKVNGTNMYVLKNKASVSLCYDYGDKEDVKETNEVTVLMPLDELSIEVKKSNEVTGENIANAEFNVYEWDGNDYSITSGKMKYESFDNGTTGKYIIKNLRKTDTNQGKFKIVETVTPWGHVGSWSKEVVIGTNATETYEATNPMGMGTITILKKGKHNEVLSGAVYSIKAKENIVSPQGKVLVNAGTEVDKVTTGKDGKAVSKELYPGKYTVMETNAPLGYALNTTPQDVEVKYQDKDTKVTNSSVTFVNDRLYSVITVTKEIDTADIVWEHGNPTFTFKVDGTDVLGNAHTYYETVEFTTANVGNGAKATLSAKFTVLAGTYTVSEEKTARYAFGSIHDVVSGTVSGQTAVLNVSGKKDGTETAGPSGAATFYNVKATDEDLTHTSFVKNTIA